MWTLTASLPVLRSQSVSAAVPGEVDHWAFRPIVCPSSPIETRGWPGANSELDRLATAALERSQRTLQQAADRRVLIRRLSFDLRGLPPSPDEVAAFVHDSSEDAYQRLVDRFLDSPHYGERWGRHWLDIVGYADSNGYFNADSDRPLAWKYRDYVVRSLNANKPLDRFIQEQLAGDELCGYVAGGDVTPEMVDPLIATHFWRNAPDGTGESDGNPLEVKVDKYSVLEGNVQIFGSAFLGLTLQCARCHDHKFEPVKQADYYALEAILRPAFEVDHWLKPNERVIEVGLRSEREANHRRIEEADRNLKTLHDSLEGLTAPFRKQALAENLAALPEPLRNELQQALDTKEKARTSSMQALLKAHEALVNVGDDVLRARFPALAKAAEALQMAVASREKEKPAPLERIAATFETTNTTPVHHLLLRGNHANEGAEVEPAIPVVFRPSRASSIGSMDGRSSGRRLALARWVTARDNPVVARVLVNRIWHYHFGHGLVSTPDNLGRSGARPAAPELLDFLASELVDSGWDLKLLHRLILNSAVWKQALSSNPELDPALSRSLSQRLDAESLRDAMLTVSGELDVRLGGRPTGTSTDKEGQIVIDEGQPGARRRSLYLQQRRTMPVAFLSTFDGPAHNPVCVQRVSSTVALQSLAMLNSEFVHLRARAFARRILQGRTDRAALDSSVQSRLVDSAFELAFARPATNPEMSAALEFLRDQAAIYAGQSDLSLRTWTDFCQMLFASNTFLYVD